MKTKEVIKKARKVTKPFRVTDGKKFRLKDIDPGELLGFSNEDKPRAREMLAASIQALTELQDKFYADDQWALLLIFQAIDEFVALADIFKVFLEFCPRVLGDIVSSLSGGPGFREASLVSPGFEFLLRPVDPDHGAGDIIDGARPFLFPAHHWPPARTLGSVHFGSPV